MAGMIAKRVLQALVLLALAVAIWFGWCAALPTINRHLQEAVHLSAAQQQVDVQGVHLSWHGMGPAVHAQSFALQGEHGFELKAHDIWISIDFFDSLWARHWVLDTIHLQRADMHLELGASQSFAANRHWEGILNRLLSYVHRIEIETFVCNRMDANWPWPMVHDVKGYVLGKKAILEGHLQGSQSHVDLLLEWDRPTSKPWRLSRSVVRYQGQWQGQWLKPWQSMLHMPDILVQMDGEGQLIVSVDYLLSGCIDASISGSLHHFHVHDGVRSWDLKHIQGQWLGHCHNHVHQWTIKDLGFEFSGHRFSGIEIDWHHEAEAMDRIRINQLPVAGLHALVTYLGLDTGFTVPADSGGLLESVVLDLPKGFFSAPFSLWPQINAKADFKQVHIAFHDASHLLGPMQGEVQYQGHDWSVMLHKHLAWQVLQDGQWVEHAVLDGPLRIAFNDQDQTFAWQSCSFSMPGARLTLSAEGRLPLHYQINGTFVSDDLHQWVQAWPDMPAWPWQHWLKQALVQGRAEKGQVAIQVDNRHLTGTVQASLAQGQLHYADAWPDVSNLQGDLTIDLQKGLQWQGQGHFCQTPDIDLSIDMPFKPVSTLHIQGHADVHPHRWFGCFKGGPLWEYFEPFQSVIELKGDAPMALDLTLPLVDDPKYPLRYSGQIDLKGLVLDLRHGPWDWHRLKGVLFFDQDRIWGQDLQGYWQGKNFDVPVHFNVNTVKVPKRLPEITIDFEWRDAWPAMLKRWPVLQPWFKDRVEGKSLFHGRYVFDKHGTWHRFEIQSGLLGTRIQWPWGVLKDAKAVMPFRWQLFPRNEDQGFEGTLRLGEAIQVRYQTAKNHVLDHLRVHLGKRLPSGWLGASGFELSGYIPQWSFNEAGGHRKWQALLHRRLAFDLHVGQLHFDAFSERDVRLKGSYADNDLLLHWHSPRLAGLFERSASGLRLLLDYVRLNQGDVPLGRALWQRFHQKDDTPLKSTALFVRLSHAQFDDYHLDALEMEAELSAKALVAKRIEIKDAANFKGSGAWRWQSDQSWVGLRGQITSDDFGRFADKWLASKSFDLGRGRLDIDVSLHRPGEPGWIDRLEGMVDMDCRDGHFQEFSHALEEKLNLSRWLNALSFQNLSKMMAMDLNALEKGYHTDRITGTLHFKDGDVRTTNLTVLGSELSVWLNGHIDMLDHTGEVQVKVQVPVTSSLPFLATVTAGPGAGLAAWVADKLILKHVPGLSIHRYRLIGKKDGQISIEKLGEGAKNE